MSYYASVFHSRHASSFRFVVRVVIPEIFLIRVCPSLFNYDVKICRFFLGFFHCYYWCVFTNKHTYTIHTDTDEIIPVLLFRFQLLPSV